MELKILWNMKVTVLPIVIGPLGIDTKGLVQGLEDLEIRGWVETIWTTALLRLAKIQRRVLQTWGDLLVTQTPVKDHQLTRMWKTLQDYYYHYYYHVKQPEYWEESWRLEETCCHSNYSEKPSAKNWCEKLSRSK